jgi:hypothetical protein
LGIVSAHADTPVERLALGVIGKRTMTSPPEDEFAHVVRLAPLVSIDLVIRDNEQKVLVALRTNEPAKGVYFVPGGCILKNEAIEPHSTAY